jgi:hypothetical protein
LKRIDNLWSKIKSDDNLKRAIFVVNMTHRYYGEHKRDRTVAWIERDIPARVKDLKEILENFSPGRIRSWLHWDKSAEKWRKLTEPQLWPDQYVHHALIQVLEPGLRRGMDPYCCGSVPGRGITYGVTAIQKWMKNDQKGTRYCLEADIHHFYDTLKPQVVMCAMRRIFKCGKTLTLIERIMEGGILTGLYTSIWFANTALQPLDHLIREGGFGTSHNVRYVDNFTIFASSKKKLRRVLFAMRSWLSAYGMAIKGNWQIFDTRDRLPSALGYRYGHGFTLIRKRNLLRMKRQLSDYYRRVEKRKRITIHLAAGLLSRLGQMRWCNRVKLYERYLKPKTQRALKDVIRDFMRKEQMKYESTRKLEPLALYP